MIVNDSNNFFVVEVTNDNMVNSNHRFNLGIGSQVIFDKTLEAKENSLVMVENKQGDTFMVVLSKNSKNKLIGRFIHKDCNDIEIPVERVLGIGIKRLSNIIDF